jgi:5-methylcytosine-specific restriction endonuclease McrA
VTRRNPTAARNTSARRRNRLKAAKEVHREVTLEWAWKRQGGRCYLCGLPVALEKAHLEHKTPLSRGGEHSRKNAGASCASCNLRKGRKTVGEFEKAKAKKGLKRRAFRRKPRPLDDRARAERERREFDQRQPVADATDDIPDEVF